MWGCGWDLCASCSPFQYGCEMCNEDFEKPLPIGESFICPGCEWVNDRKENKERV